MDLTEFQRVSNSHAVLTQYHRWFQVYERPLNEARVRNQMDLLTPDVTIETASGSQKGRDGLAERLKVYDGWKNAHHVQSFKIEQRPDQTLSLVADILYQGIIPGQGQRSYPVHYEAQLEVDTPGLPRFKTVKLTAGEPVTPALFEDAYAQNRVRSLMHRWLYLIELTRGDSAPFMELLADSFQLYLSDGAAPLDNRAKLDGWLQSIPGRTSHSAHYVKNFTVRTQANGTFAMAVDLDWRGLTPDGKRLGAETHHEWTIQDNPNERFARIKTFRVSLVRPFHEILDE